MEPRPVPSSVIENTPTGQTITVGRPPDIDPDECGDASMFVEPVQFAGQSEYPMFSAYFQPTQEDLFILNQGGLVRFNMLGHVVPHSCRVVENG